MAMKRGSDLTQPPDGREARSPMAIAATWGSRITTVALEMVVPGLIGFWIDSRLGTKMVFGMAGFAFGLTLGIWHLVQMAKADDRPPRNQRPEQDGVGGLPSDIGQGRSNPTSRGTGSKETGSKGPHSGGTQ